MSDIVCPEDLRARLVKYVEKLDGVKNAAAQLGLTRETVSRAAAGFPVRTGTLALLREKLPKGG